MSYNTARPYLASFVLLRRGNKIACIMRSNTDWKNGYYGLPAGKIEKNETAIQGAIREAKEEAGVEIKESNIRFVHASHRKAVDDTEQWLDLFFEATEWLGEPYNAEPHKHSELTWIDINDLPNNVLPELRFALEQIANKTPFSIYGW